MKTQISTNQIQTAAFANNSQLQFPALTPRLIALGLLAAALLALGMWLTGCSNGPRAGADAGAGITSNTVAGEYTLVSVDGKTVPCVISHEGAGVSVKSGGFSIRADGTCQSRSVFSVPGGQEINRLVDATYDLSGTNLTMHWKGAGVTTGSVSGNTFTMNNEGMIFAYQK